MAYTPDPAEIVATIRASLERGEAVKIKITSDSMLPLIKKGDFISIVNKSVDSVEVGAIITFVRDGVLFTHRVIQKDLDNGIVLTKGDHLKDCDPPTTPQNIIGIVVSRNRENDFLDFLSGHGYHLSRILFRLSQVENSMRRNSTICNHLPICTVFFRGFNRLLSYFI